MFGLGIFPDEISQDFEWALRVTKELGLKYVELRTMWNKNLVELSEPELRKVKLTLRKENLHVSCIASPFLKCKMRKGQSITEKDTYFMQEKGPNQHIDILRHSCELAKMFSTRLVRCFSFLKETRLTKESLDEIVENFRVPLQIAEKEGVILGLENEHICNIATGVDAYKLFRQIDSPILKLIWDPGNAFFAGEIPYPDGYSLIKDYVVHVHVKDAQRSNKTAKAKWMPIGKGEIDFKKQLQALLVDKFNGVVSLETHYVPQGGSQEEGTRMSFEGLKKILRGIGVKW